MREKVEHIFRLLTVTVWVGLLAMDKIWKFDSITDKERRRIVAHQIPISVFGIELHRKSTRVTLGIGSTTRASDRGEAGEQVRALAYLRHHFHFGPFDHVGVGDFEVPMSAGTDRMHHSLRNPFTVKSGQLFYEISVLQQNRTVDAGSLGILVIRDGCTGCSGKCGALFHWNLLMFIKLRCKYSFSLSDHGR